MKRFCIILATTFGLSIGLAGTAAATEPAITASPGVSGVPDYRNAPRAVWYTYTWRKTYAICASVGRNAVNDGLGKAWACEYDKNPPDRAYPWRVRLLD